MPQQQPSDRTTVAIGAITAAAGGYFLLAGMGLVPAPGAAHGPGWIVAAAGFAFFFAGISVVLRAFTRTPDASSDLAPGAPDWAKTLYHLLGLAIAIPLALLGTWIAFGSGSRAFQIAMPFGSASGGEIFGRVAFGIGAAIVWLYVIALLVTGARRWFRRSPGKP